MHFVKQQWVAAAHCQRACTPLLATQTTLGLTLHSPACLLPRVTCQEMSSAASVWEDEEAVSLMQALPSVQPLLASQSGFLNRLVRNPGQMGIGAGAGTGQASAGESMEKCPRQGIGQGVPSTGANGGWPYGFGLSSGYSQRRHTTWDRPEQWRARANGSRLTGLHMARRYGSPR